MRLKFVDDELKPLHNKVVKGAREIADKFYIEKEAILKKKKTFQEMILRVDYLPKPARLI